MLLAAISFEFGGSTKIGEYVLYGSAAFHGAGLFGFAILEGIISEYVTRDCQGVAFGVVTSYRGSASTVSPFAFGILFTTLSETRFSATFIVLGIVVAMVMIR